MKILLMTMVMAGMLGSAYAGCECGHATGQNWCDCMSADGQSSYCKGLAKNDPNC